MTLKHRVQSVSGKVELLASTRWFDLATLVRIHGPAFGNDRLATVTTEVQ